WLYYVFVLQIISSKFISGLIILAERPIKIGDRVGVDKVAGQVIDIRARSTTIVTNDNITLIVPNSVFTAHTIINWSHGDQKVRFRIPMVKFQQRYQTRHGHFAYPL